jgi:hypothetical protein
MSFTRVVAWRAGYLYASPSAALAGCSEIFLHRGGIDFHDDASLS